MMAPYARVTYRPEGGSSVTVLLNIQTDGALLCGTEVGRDGGTRWFDKGTTERVHVISAEIVERRVPLRMDNYLGVLVEES